MNNISFDNNKTVQAIFNDYQEQLSLCLMEIKQVQDIAEVRSLKSEVRSKTLVR
jgi:hypothetical protein